MLAATLAAVAMLSSPDGVSAIVQTDTPTAQVAPRIAREAPADLGEVIVEGRRLEDLTRDFVNEVAAPARRRGLARWRDKVCVGVANLQAEAAGYIADRVSTVAQDVGLEVGAPGCRPSILISFTSDANAFTEDFVARRPRLFRVGGAGMDRGGAAFQHFLNTDRAVRWWVVSAPVDPENGQIATRLPGMGDDNGSPGQVMRFAPNIDNRGGASRLTTQITDDVLRAFIIVDVDRLNGVSLEQLADYLALVALAQIDPEADTSGYLSVLNVFDDPLQTDGLTQWDQAYLQGLYDAQRTRRNTRANATAIMDSIVRAHRDLTAEQDQAAD